MNIRASFTALAIAVLAAAPALAAQPDGLLEVRQLVFGMDCAPCAHAIRTGLLELQGVKTAGVNLNSGLVVVTLAPGNDVKLADIRKAILKEGFTPKGTQVTVAGQLVRQADEIQLVTSRGESYRLASDPKKQAAWSQLSAWPSGSTLEVQGTIPSGDLSNPVIMVAAVLKSADTG